ncbi:diaminopimelate decarboxylase, partial [Candidatus Gracilibacteria bacterium]|nr:diaminopimelate decarboxylase [Candidatus Gracilibacteria bacterium]
MTAKTTPLTLKKVKEIAKIYSTPFVIYDEKAILDNFKEFKEAFSWVDGFQNYYAVKACPNPTIIKALSQLGSGADCSSMGELVMSELIGITGKNVMFTSNNTKYDEFMKAHKMGAIINFDDITHIDYYKEHIGFYPRIACCRYNPGPLKKGNTIIGKPEEAKYGMKKEQLFEAYEKLQKWGTKHFGLHTMVASNELDPAYFIETAKILFELVVEIEEKLG